MAKFKKHASDGQLNDWSGNVGFRGTGCGLPKEQALCSGGWRTPTFKLKDSNDNVDSRTLIGVCPA